MRAPPPARMRYGRSPSCSPKRFTSGVSGGRGRRAAGTGGGGAVRGGGRAVGGGRGGWGEVVGGGMRCPCWAGRELLQQPGGDGVEDLCDSTALSSALAAGVHSA